MVFKNQSYSGAKQAVHPLHNFYANRGILNVFSLIFPVHASTVCSTAFQGSLVAMHNNTSLLLAVAN